MFSRYETSDQQGRVVYYNREEILFLWETTKKGIQKFVWKRKNIFSVETTKKRSFINFKLRWKSEDGFKVMDLMLHMLRGMDAPCQLDYNDHPKSTRSEGQQSR